MKPYESPFMEIETLIFDETLASLPVSAGGLSPEVEQEDGWSPFV